MCAIKPFRGQMSDSFRAAVFIVLSGGFQDAYTYTCRGEVFALATDHPALRDLPASGGRISPARPGASCQCAGVLCLRHAGPDLPQGSGPCLCQHHVHRKPPLRDGGPLRLFPYPGEGDSLEGSDLFQRDPDFRRRCRLGQRPDPCLGDTVHLDLLPPADGQLQQDVRAGTKRIKKHKTAAEGDRSLCGGFYFSPYPCRY